MLEQILMHLNNWFTVEIVKGDYKIENGGIVLPFLKDGQYFRVVGSVFNDGLHQYPATDLTDEEFSGSIWALAIPKAVISIADEVQAWQEKYKSTPYTSESFANYSYSKATNANGVPLQWQEVFANRLNAYRKIGGIMYVAR